MQFTIFDKTGENVRCTTRKLEYNGTFMGECSVTVDIMSPIPIDFHIGDFLVYRGERFEINYDPSVIKTAKRQKAGDSFKYEKIKFNSLSDELTRADFLDYVINDNNVHFTALPNFSFFCSTVSDLASRIQANLNRVYTGANAWTVTVHPEFVGKTDVSISVSNIKVWDALALANTEFGANFIIRGRTITIGTAGIAVGSMFSYGKGNGLFEIERNAEPDQAIITRLRAYGSEKNLPPRYYNKITNGSSNSYIPNNMAVTHLMLPGFPATTQDPYIDSSNVAQLGVREGTVFFDGSDGNEEIYPSIEGMTYNGVHIDVVQSAEQVTDDGVWEIPEGETSVNIPNFTITLYDLGFDIRDYLIEGQNPAISMKTGMCAGREFEIVNVTYDEVTGYYTLECKRSEDTSLGLVFPYYGYNVSSGDKFVLLYISMPPAYINAASTKLYNAAVAYLAKNDYVRYSYSPKVDNIFMQRQHDNAVLNSGTSIHDTIKEGDLLLFSDEDLGIDGSIIIDQLTIKEGEELIPQYEITLRNDKTVGTIQRMQQQIDSIVSGGTAVGGYNAQQIQSLIKAYGDMRYIRKDIDDIARGLITSLKGFQIGANFISGLLGEGGTYRLEADGKSYIEIDKLYVRMKAYFDEIEVRRYIHSGGNRIASKTGNKISKVVYYDSQGNVTDNANNAAYYRCYFRLTDDDGNSITNDWQVGDLARCQEFNNNSGTHSYWRAVISVGSVADADGLGYIDLSNRASETFTHNGNTYTVRGVDSTANDVPLEQDDVIQLGNIFDTERQGAIIEITGGTNAPSYQIYQNIGAVTPNSGSVQNPYSLSNKNYVTFGYNSATGKAELISYGDVYFGDRTTTDQQGNIVYPNSYFKFDSSTHQVTVKADLKVTSPSATTTTEVNLVDWIYGDFKNIEEIKQQQKDVTRDKDDKNTQYTSLTHNTDFAALVAAHDPTAEGLYNNIVTTKGNFDDAYDYYISVVSSALADGTLTASELDDIELAYSDYIIYRSFYDSRATAIEDYLLHLNYQGIADLDYLKAALREDTEIRGGLIQSSLLSLGYHEVTTGVYKTTAGLNGVYDATKVGNGIAAWYGGKMADIEYPYVAVVSPTGNPSTKGYYEYNSSTHEYTPTSDTSVVSGKTYYENVSAADCAKSLFRMDGTGYVASGNISWNSLGQVTLKNLYTDTGESIDQLLALFSIGGTIPTDPYITPAYPFSDLSIRISSGNVVSLKDFIQSYENLFIPHYTYTAVASPSGNPSSLGYYEYNSTTQRYYPSTDTAIQSGTTYYTRTLTSIEATVDFYSDGQVSAFGLGTGGGGGGGSTVIIDNLTSTLTTAALSANQGRVLKGYIDTINSNLSTYATQTWVTSQGYLTSSSLSGYATTAQLANYLPLSGGTMANTNLVTNLNADLVDGYNASELQSLGWVTLSNSTSNYNAYWFEIGSPTSTNTTYVYDVISTRAAYPFASYFRISITKQSSTVYSISLINHGINYMGSNTNTQLCLAIDANGKCYIQSGSGNGSNATRVRCIFGNGTVNDTPVGNSASEFGTAAGFTALKVIRNSGYSNIVINTGNTTQNGEPFFLTAALKANQLSTARTLWGQSFDGSANVSGDMTGVGTLTASGLITANGNVSTASYIIIGNYKLTSTNDGLSVTRTDNTNANLYATGEVTAFGIGTSSSGDLNLAAMWESLGSSIGDYGNSQINKSHLTTALSEYTKTANLATVAISGSYQDLTDKPTIPAAQVQTDWNATTGMAAILNKPNNLVTTTSLNNTLQNYTQTSQLANYLPLAGGTMTGTINSRSIIPTSNNARDLGSTDYYFRNIYAYKYYLPNSCYIDQSSGNLCLRVGGGNANLVVDAASVRKGGQAGTVTLGTQSNAWDNIYSVLGTFSGAVTMASTLNVTGLITALGNIKTTDYIEIGDYRIVADSTNTALKVMHKNGSTDVNFYATGEVTAFGVGSSGTGGLDVDAMWAELKTPNSSSQKQIDISHLKAISDNYVTNTSLSSTLSAYVKTADLNTTLNDFAQKVWVQNNFLASYTETDPIFTASAAYGISSGDITNWNNKSDFSGSYNDLTNKPTKLSQFTNDTNYVNTTTLSSTLNNYVKSITISNAKLTYKKGDNTNTEIDIAASLGLYNKNDGNINTITAERVTYTRVGSGNYGSLPATNGYNAILNIARYSTANHSSQLGFTDDGNLYYRSFTGAADTTTAWSKIAFAGSPNNIAMIPYTIGSWSKLVNINSYGNVLLFIRLSQSSQNASYVFSITTASARARCYQLSSGNYTNNSNFNIRVTRSSNTNFDVEIKSDYAYNSATSATAYVSWICNGSTSISNSPYYKSSPTVTPYTEATAGSGTSTAAEFTTVTTADIVNATIYSPNLHLTAAEGTAPMTVSSTTMVANLQSEYSAKLKTARTLWGNLFDGSADLTGLIEADNGIKIGNAYLWWDSTNSCLVVSGASNGTPSKSVVINFAASGEISALQTS